MAANATVKGLCRGAANAGWRMMLLAATIYALILGLSAVFENMIANLPGA